MKRLLDVIVILIVLSTMQGMFGCRHSAPEHPLLLRADTLLSYDVNNPDSALVVLQSIDSVTTLQDSALYAVLFTIARFKTSFGTGDTLDTVFVNNAVRWYADHGPRHRLITAHISAAFAAETNGDYVSAMRHYKTAEMIADTADHYTLGYVHMRMGEVYCGNYGYSTQAMHEYLQAINEFKKSGSHRFVVSNLFFVATEYAFQSLDSADYYLDRSQEYAIAHNIYDAYAEDIMFERAKIHTIKGDSVEGARLAVDLVNRELQSINKNSCLYLAVTALSKCGKVEEAERYFAQLSKPATTWDSAMWFSAKQLLARAKHQPELEQFYGLKAALFDQSTLVNRHKLRIDTVASSVVAMFKAQRDRQSTQRLYLTICLVLLLIAVLGILTFSVWRRYQRVALSNERLHDEYNQELSKLSAAQTQLLNSIEHLKTIGEQDASIIRQYQDRLSMIEEQKAITRIIYDNLWQANDFNKENVVNIRLSVTPEIGITLWKRLIAYSQRKYGLKFEQFIEENFRNELSEPKDNSQSSELRFILLCSLGLPDGIICAYCRLSNLRSVSNKKYKLGEKYLGQHTSIIEWFEQSGDVNADS